MHDAHAVLFVDDEPLSQKYFKASINPFAEVLTASNPVEAREILASRSRDISVVVSDERMPLESGVPFLVGVRRSWPATRRVLTSAYADIDNLQTGQSIRHISEGSDENDIVCFTRSIEITD